MGLILETPTRNDMADAITAAIDTGAGTATLVIETSGDIEVALFSLQNPSFGNAVAGVITLLGVTLSDTSAAGGEAAQFSIFDRNGTKVLEGTVAVAGGDLDLSSLSVGVGDTVELTSFTINQVAS